MSFFAAGEGSRNVALRGDNGAPQLVKIFGPMFLLNVLSSTFLMYFNVFALEARDAPVRNEDTTDYKYRLSLTLQMFGEGPTAHSIRQRIVGQ